LGDFVAGSIVVREKRIAEVNCYWDASPGAAAPSASGAHRLNPADIGLIEAFLVRRQDLSLADDYRAAAHY